MYATFQFLYGTIKGHEIVVNKSHESNFNSCMVRLKGK